MTEHESTTTVLRKNKKVLIASLTGSAIEWFDYFLYGTAAALVFNKIFFPMVDPVIGLILSYLSFSLTFFIRPIGGVLFAHIGDRIGRKKTLVLTLSLMGGATVMIGLLPTYEMIGLWAPALLILMRIIQGMGIGGEWGGALLLAYEYAPEKRKGFFGSIPQAGVTIGMLMATFIVSLMTLFSEADFLSWGWRIPFLFGCLIVPFIFFLRRKLEETEEFSARRHHLEMRQVFKTLLANWQVVVAGMLMVAMTTTAFYLITVYAPTFGKKVLMLSASDSLLVTLLVAISNFIWLPVGGALSDRFGRKPVLIAMTLLALATSYPALTLLASAPSFSMMLSVLLWLSFLYGLYNGAMIPALTEIMPAEVRVAGFSLAYSLATAVFGGFTPVMSTALIEYTGDKASPGYWMSFAAVCALLATLYLYRRRAVSLQNTVKSEGAV